MKVAVTADGVTQEALVDPRFGRAAHVILVDSETGALQACDNIQNRNAAQGAGIQTAETVSRLGAEVVLTGHCGPKAFRALRAAGIQVVVGVTGSVGDAVAAYKAGKLRPAEAADVEGHWG